MKDWGRQEGRREGIKEGKHSEKISIARGLCKRGIDISIIADCTGLTEQEILELKEG